MMNSEALDDYVCYLIISTLIGYLFATAHYSLKMAAL
jgi:hypothetical protein